MSAPWRDRLDQVRGGDGVVDDQRHAGVVRDGGDARDVEDVVLRVGDGLGEERLGVRPHGRAPGVQVVGVLDEADLDAELGQRVVEQVVGAAVQPRAGHDVVAGVGEVEDRERLGGLAGRQEQRRDAAFERGDALLDDVLRRVHDAGVDVAGLGEAEQRGGVVGAVEGVGRGLVDRQRPRVGRDVRASGRRGPAWSRTTSWRSGRRVSVLMGVLLVSMGGSGSGSTHSATTAHAGPPPRSFSGGPSQRTRACR